MSDGEELAAATEAPIAPAQATDPAGRDATERTVSDAARLAPGWVHRAAARPRAVLLRPPARPVVPPPGRIDLYA